MLELLNNHIDELKSKGIKGLTKKKLLYELCKSGLEFQKLEKGTGNIPSQSDDIGVKHPQGPKEYIIESKTELKLLQEALIEKESRLLQKEDYLNNREILLINKYNEALEIRETGFNLQVTAFNMNKKSTLNEQKVVDQKEVIDKLEKENKRLRREVMKILYEILENTKGNTFMDIILPLVTTGLVGYNSYQGSNNKMTGDIDPDVKKIIGNYQKLSSEEKTELSNSLKDFLGIFSDKKPKE